MKTSLREKGLSKIKSLFGKRATDEAEDLVVYSFDATRKKAFPLMVVFPENEDEIKELVKIASEYTLPLIPRGAGSGFAGGAVPFFGGVILSSERMRKIKEIDEKNLLAIVEPGVITGDLHKAVEDRGLFYPPDPASLEFSTIGGNLSTNAGGLRAVKYGVTRDYVLSLRAVIGDGSIINTRAKTIKDVTGYDLTGLFVGAEGTLGFVSEITLKLIPKPEAKGTVLAAFPSVKDAIKCGIEIIRKGILPATMEFIDKSAVELVKKFSEVKISPSTESVLLIEDDGFEESVKRSLRLIKMVCEENGALEVEETIDPNRSTDMWKIRRAISPALAMIAPFRVNQDIAVLRTEVEELLRRATKIAEKWNLKMVNFGHLGDGNIHVNFLYGKDPSEEERVKSGVKELLENVLELKGTISGEHGIGMVKLTYMKRFLSPKIIELMQGIKRIFDPKNIFNPGKAVPYEEVPSF